ncbi:MAG: hypothetical protein AAB834_06245 [Patescibacteria group bacterium]
MKQYLRQLSRVILYGVCGFVTVFVLANSYVTAFGKPLPFINAVKEIDLSFFQPELANNTAMQADSRFEGNYGAPVLIKIGDNKVRIPVAQPVRNGDAWLARSSTAHYSIEGASKNGDIGDTIIYMNAGKTTVARGYDTKPGSNISLDTKRDWRYFYRIDEVISIQKNQRYVLPSNQTSRLYVVVQEADRTTTIMAATLTNVQNADQ